MEFFFVYSQGLMSDQGLHEGVDDLQKFSGPLINEYIFKTLLLSFLFCIFFLLWRLLSSIVLIFHSNINKKYGLKKLYDYIFLTGHNPNREASCRKLTMEDINNECVVAVSKLKVLKLSLFKTNIDCCRLKLHDSSLALLIV